jgi:hypothetical protein
VIHCFDCHIYFFFYYYINYNIFQNFIPNVLLQSYSLHFFQQVIKVIKNTVPIFSVFAKHSQCDRPLPPEIPLITNGRQISKSDCEVCAIRDRTFYHLYKEQYSNFTMEQ